MSLLRREQGTCTGRGFAAQNANGFLRYFYSWVTKSIANGGPGWYILRDQSATPANITFTANATTNIFTAAGHGFYNGERVIVSSTGTLPNGLSTNAVYTIRRIDANTFYLCGSRNNLHTNTPADIGDTGTGTHSIRRSGPYIIISDVQNPTVNQVCKILQVGYEDTYSGWVSVQGFLSWDNANQTASGVWFGYPIKTLDAAAFIYDFRGGPENLLLQSRISQDNAWYRAGIDEWVGLTNFLQSNDTFNAVTQADVLANANNVVVTVQDEATASQFIKNRGYYIYNFSFNNSIGANRCIVTYGIVNAIGVADGLAANQIRFTGLPQIIGPNQTIPSGSIITPYAHRFYAYGNYNPWSSSSYTNMNWMYLSYTPCVPYSSYSATLGAYVIHNQYDAINSRVRLCADYDTLNTYAPGDDGTFLVQKPLANEYYSVGQSTGLNGVLGETKNLYVSNQTSLVDMEVGRVINGLEYISLGNGQIGNQLHVLVQHSEVLV